MVSAPTPTLRAIARRAIALPSPWPLGSRPSVSTVNEIATGRYRHFRHDPADSAGLPEESAYDVLWADTVIVEAAALERAGEVAHA